MASSVPPRLSLRGVPLQALSAPLLHAPCPPSRSPVRGAYTRRYNACFDQ
uniref:Uncharacterized protein n=1 Tax=Arundo donax TaxID=35708 RepID=A0A0A9HQ03_ARUDO